MRACPQRWVLLGVVAAAYAIAAAGARPGPAARLLLTAASTDSRAASGPVKHSVALSGDASPAALRTPVLLPGGSIDGDGIDGDGIDGGDGEGVPIDYSDYALPFCNPEAGLLCADTDLLTFLDVQVDNIEFDGTPLAELQTAAQASGAVGGTLDLFGDQVEASTGVGAAGGVTSNILSEGFNADVAGETTLTGVTVDSSRLDQLYPDSVRTSVGRTDVDNLFNRVTYNPRLQYVLGLNFGLPFGLATVSETGGR